MFFQTWVKYIPVIRILLKRSLNEEQKLSMNSSDFHRAAGGRKVKFDFSFSLQNGKLQTTESAPPVGKDLVDALKDDDLCSRFIKKHHLDLSMNKNFELLIKNVPVEDINPQETDEELSNGDDTTPDAHATEEDRLKLPQ
jgi:hypothetical protein